MSLQRKYQHANQFTSLEQRFWRRIRGDRESCWPWPGYKNADGYGIVRVGGRRERAHRLAWVRTFGVIPDGLVVCHRCDNPPCCNPRHLFLATQADNLHDMATKGRASRAAKVKGEAHPRAKLTAKQVVEIRAARIAGTSSSDLAAAYGISTGHVRRLGRGRGW